MIRAALIGFVLVAVVGCTGAPAGSAGIASPSAATSPMPTGTGGPSPSGTPVSPAASPIATTPPPSAPAVDLYYPPEARFAPQFGMRVMVSGLNVRARPSTAGTKIATAPKNSVFLVSDWGIKADGYTWYLGYQALLEKDGSVPPLPTPFVAGIDPLTGWLAAGTASSPFLEPVAPRCPTQVDLRNVEAMLDSELANCFNTQPIVLTGTYGCGGCGGAAPGMFTPAWLAGPLDFSFLSVNPATQVGPFAAHFPPGGPAAPPNGAIIRVTGHFHDSRAPGCVIAPQAVDGTDKPIASSVATAYCGSRFVVTSFVVLGADPSFPS